MGSCFCTGACHKYGTCNGQPLYPYSYTLPSSNFVPQQRLGWQCPKCSTIHSPDTLKCVCSNFNLSFSGGVGSQLLNERENDDG